MKSPRIALIHATPVAIDPIVRTFRQMWPEALAAGSRIGLIATFVPSIPALREELEQMAVQDGRKVEIITCPVPDALAELHEGRADEHDRLIAAAAEEVGPCDALILGQFSMASAAALIPDRAGRRVLTSPASAVTQLKRQLGP